MSRRSKLAALAVFVFVAALIALIRFAPEPTKQHQKKPEPVEEITPTPGLYDTKPIEEDTAPAQPAPEGHYEAPGHGDGGHHIHRPHVSTCVGHHVRVCL